MYLYGDAMLHSCVTAIRKIIEKSKEEEEKIIKMKKSSIFFLLHNTNLMECTCIMQFILLVNT